MANDLSETIQMAADATAADATSTPAEQRSDATVLAGYPGAAVMAAPDATVLDSNSKGQGLATLLTRGGTPEIHDMINKAADRGTIVGGPVSLASSKGEVVLEITAIPQHDGHGVIDRVMVLSRDLTMERNLRSTLVESRQRFKDLVEVSSDFSWEVDTEGRFVFVTPKGALGYTADQLIGTPAEDLVVDAEEFAPVQFISERQLENVELWLKRKDGLTACVVLSTLPLTRDRDGRQEWLGCRGVCRDVTDERESEAALARARHREQLLNYIVSQVRDELEPHNMLSAAAAATARALGAAGARIYRMDDLKRFAVAADYGNAEGLDDLLSALGNLKSGGEVLKLEAADWRVLVTATHYRSQFNGALAIWKSTKGGTWDEDHQLLISDVANQLGIANEQISNHERIVALSRTDSMTGLLNRRAFCEEELPRRVGRLQRNSQTAALFYVDMDNFKRVNDVHGHQAGDDAILFLRDMLHEFSRPGDVIARLGGDEFAMWLDGITAETAERRVADLIQTSKAMLKMSGDADNPLGISIGIAVFDPIAQESLDDLLARADQAMYAVKKNNKGGYAMAPPPTQAASAPIVAPDET